MNIDEFLLARIAEDEAVARAADALSSAPWCASYGRQVESERNGHLVTPEDEYAREDDPPDAIAEHIARHDPARVLAECEAKRRIVTEHEITYHVHHRRAVGTPAGFVDVADSGHYQRCDADDLDGAEPFGCATLQALAGIYADHPDYDPAWRM